MGGNEDTAERFSSEIRLRIDWSEVDAFGHVNNLAILKYVQAARVQCLERLGLMQSQAEEKIGPILASISCQFRRPLFYPGDVTVRSKVDNVGNTSFRIRYGVYDGRCECAAEAHDIIVLFDFRAGTKMPLPDTLRNAIARSNPSPRTPLRQQESSSCTPRSA